MSGTSLAAKGIEAYCEHHGIDLYRIRLLSRWYALRRSGKCDIVLKVSNSGTLLCSTGPTMPNTQWTPITLEELGRVLDREDNRQ